MNILYFLEDEMGEAPQSVSTISSTNASSTFESPKRKRNKYYVRNISSDGYENRPVKNKVKKIKDNYKKYMDILKQSQMERVAETAKAFLSFSHLYTLDPSFRQTANNLITYYDTAGEDSDYA